MGVLPLQFKEGESAQTHGILGNEKFSIGGISNGLKPLSDLAIKIESEDGSSKEIEVICRLDSIVEIDYYYNGGILQTVLRQMIKSN
jgi:aconitate hydratase